MKDKRKRQDEQRQCLAILKGVAHIMSAEPDPDFSVKELFPDLEFLDDDQAEGITVESTIATLRMILPTAVPRGGAAC